MNAIPTKENDLEALAAAFDSAHAVSLIYATGDGWLTMAQKQAVIDALRLVGKPLEPR